MPFPRANGVGAGSQNGQYSPCSPQMDPQLFLLLARWALHPTAAGTRLQLSPDPSRNTTPKKATLFFLSFFLPFPTLSTRTRFTRSRERERERLVQHLWRDGWRHHPLQSLCPITRNNYIFRVTALAAAKITKYL